jgi:hypothetical protein
VLFRSISTNIFVRRQDYFDSYRASAVHKSELDSNEPFSKITSNYDEQKLSYRVMGFIFKPGINLDFSPLKLGLTITTPAISLGLLNNQANKVQLSVLPDEDQSFINESNSHTNYSGVYRTPLSVNIGADYHFNKVNVSLSAEWFSKVNKYELIKKKDLSVDMKFPTADDPKFAIPLMANKSIVNIGFAVVYKFKESLTYMGSFRTDFNYFDNEALNRNEDFVPNGSFWDIYHITSGLVFAVKRSHIAFGVNFGHGRSENDQQYINMTTASQSNFLRGELNNSTSSKYSNLSFTIGVNFDLTGDDNNNQKLNN